MGLSTHITLHSRRKADIAALYKFSATISWNFQHSLNFVVIGKLTFTLCINRLQRTHGSFNTLYISQSQRNRNSSALYQTFCQTLMEDSTQYSLHSHGKVKVFALYQSFATISWNCQHTIHFTVVKPIFPLCMNRLQQSYGTFNILFISPVVDKPTFPVYIIRLQQSHGTFKTLYFSQSQKSRYAIRLACATSFLLSFLFIFVPKTQIFSNLFGHWKSIPVLMKGNSNLFPLQLIIILKLMLYIINSFLNAFDKLGYRIFLTKPLHIFFLFVQKY